MDWRLEQKIQRKRFLESEFIRQCQPLTDIQVRLVMVSSNIRIIIDKDGNMISHETKLTPEAQKTYDECDRFKKMIMEMVFREDKEYISEL